MQGLLYQGFNYKFYTIQYTVYKIQGLLYQGFNYKFYTIQYTVYKIQGLLYQDFNYKFYLTMCNWISKVYFPGIKIKNKEVNMKSMEEGRS